MNTSFSGHEKFECKSSWLSLVFKHPSILTSDIEQAIELSGIGSNKIKSVRQWFQKLKLTEHNIFTKEAEIILAQDPYLERLDSLWILHTYITQNFDKATLYFLFFNQFTLTKFTKESLLFKIKEWCKIHNLSMSQNTLESDISVFVKMYNKNSEKNNFSDALFSELNILQKIDNEYNLNLKAPASLSDKCFVYILTYFIRKHTGNTLSVKDLQFGNNSLQNSLCLTEEKFLEKLMKLEELTNHQMVYQEAAGIKQIYIYNMQDLQKHLLAIYQ